MEESQAKGRKGLSFRRVVERIKEDDIRSMAGFNRSSQRCVTVLTEERVRVYAVNEGVPAVNLRETTLRIGVPRIKVVANGEGTPLDES